MLLDSKEIQRSDIASEKLRLLLIPFSDNTSQVSIIGVNYPEQVGENACNETHDPPFSYLLSPLQQSKMNISYSEIICVDELVLVQKYESSPACIKSESIPKLIERGWIKESSQEYSTYFSNDTTKDIPVLTANNNAADYSVDEKGRIDLDKVMIPIDERYGGIDYEKLGYLVAEYDLKKQLSQKNIEHSEDDYLFSEGFSLDSYPPHNGYCAFVKSSDGKEYWYGGWFHKDTLSKSEIYDHNPNPCRPNEQSCACDLQKKLAVNNLETLSYFDSSEEESVGSTLQRYLSISNISNVSNQFVVGKYNIDKGLFVTPFCGKFVGKSNIKEFEGSMQFGQVTEFSLRQIPELCAINDDSTTFDFTYSGNN